MLKQFVKNNPKLTRVPIHIFNRLNLSNKLRVGKTNNFSYGTSWLKGLKISCSGKNNKISVADKCKLSGSEILIVGNNNTVIIDENAYINTTVLTLIGDNNLIHIGKHTSINKLGEVAALEGTKVEIGEDCMISSEVQIRSGDSHPIFNSDNEIVNHAKNIFIGNHVWLGVRVMCLKGTHIEDGSIVGAMSLVSGQFENKNAILAGIPAREKKTGFTWARD